MPTFVHPALLWGLLLVGVPVLIHLINMMRHRRVPWAAMEFLLVSQRKNRTWVLLKQLLLLLVRMLAVALLVLMVAQPLLRNRLGHWIGGGRTHHIILLDDSYSMSDRWGDTSAFDDAKAVVQRIADEAARQAQPQTFTLLRFSEVGRPGIGTQPDLLDQPVSSDLTAQLRQRLDGMEVSETAAGPHGALEALPQLLGVGDHEERVIYLLTDFRARQWDDATEVRNQLAKVVESGGHLHLIDCVDASHANLALARLEPAPGTRAAGVPLFMEVAVRNYGPAPVRDVPVLLETDGQARPAVTVPEIPAGAVVTVRFAVQFSTAGQHRIAARLESDAVTADNDRYCVVDFPLDVPVLLVDGDPAASDAKYVAAALAPGGPVATGIRPRIEGPRYLSLSPLEGFRAIYLFNIERLEKSAVDALERYVSAGGGVVLFAGEHTGAPFINEELYRGGKGFFPAPLAAPAELRVDRLQKSPDLEVSAHPIFQVFSGERNSFLATVNIDHYFAVASDWNAASDPAVQVLAKLRNGAPLALERKYGHGRVLAFLTSAAPVWNNWARGNPTYVVTMLELQSYLAGQTSEETSHAVGTALSVALKAADYAPQMRFAGPHEDKQPALLVDAAAAPDGMLRATLGDTPSRGFYTLRLSRKDGTGENRLYAINVDPAEGDLRALGSDELASRLAGIPYDFERAPSFRYAARDLEGYNLGEALLYTLVVLLVLEQLLAWSASYHPTSRHRLAARGGAA